MDDVSTTKAGDTRMTTENRAAPGPTKDTGSDHRGWNDDESGDAERSAVAAAAASAEAVTA